MSEPPVGATAPSEHQELAMVADRLLGPVMLLDGRARIAYANPAAALVLRQEVAWLTGRDFLAMVHPADRRRLRREWLDLVRGRPASQRSTFRLRAQPDIEWRSVEWTADNVLDVPPLAGVLVSLRDLTEQFAEREMLATAAYVDALTGLPNRARVSEEVARVLATADDLCVVFMSVDRFTLINDSLGHANGDRLLQLVAKRVRATVPAGTMVGRFNGNGLVVVMTGRVALAAAPLAWRVVERMREPLFAAGHELRLTMSAGIARRDASSTTESLLSEASLALHHAKDLGGGRVEAFESAMRDAAAERLSIEADLRGAISLGGLSLAFQPIVRLADSSPVASEALVRWTRRGVAMEPAQFIEIAETTGLIVPLGEWVFQEAARRVADVPGARVSINLSPRELASPHLIESVSRVIADRAIPPGTIAFEITETLLMTHFDHALQMLSALRRSGSKVGLDDFGSGYSSLSYVRRLPLDFIKLDRSLTEDVDVDGQARAVVGAVIAMASALDIDVIAEGIERPAQARTLSELGAGYGQGYLFGRPAEVTQA
jgi:diguanylate cyclase (GGDEF)-like protein